MKAQKIKKAYLNTFWRKHIWFTKLFAFTLLIIYPVAFVVMYSIHHWEDIVSDWNEGVGELLGLITLKDEGESE